MKKRKSLLWIALLFSVCAFAQEASTTDTPAKDPGCLLATDRNDWMALGLTTEQLRQVEGLHTACVTDCTIKNESGKKLVPISSVLKVYEDKVLRVLGKEKYKQWQQWCAERPIKG